MTEFTDWTAPADKTAGLAVLLPARNYPATMPLLTFAGRAALHHGWRVRAVVWTPPNLDPLDTISWVGDQLAEAVGAHTGPVTVIAKSLGTCAADCASRRGYDAVWLTPLLHLPEVVEAMTASPARQLLIGGSNDDVWNLEVARTISSDALELEGADHAIFTDDAVRTAELHVDATRAIDRWLGAGRSAGR